MTTDVLVAIYDDRLSGDDYVFKTLHVPTYSDHHTKYIYLFLTKMSHKCQCLILLISILIYFSKLIGITADGRVY